MDLAHERAHIRKVYGQYQNSMGEAVVWWEYDAVDSAYDPVYDEDAMDGARSWKTGLLVPAMWVNEIEGAKTQSLDGRQVRPELRLAISVETMRQVGISSPNLADRHLNDLIGYRGTYWKVTGYQIRGRLRDNLIVGVTAVKVFISDEWPNADPPTFPGFPTTDMPKGFPTDASERTWPQHELPANH